MKIRILLSYIRALFMSVILFIVSRSKIKISIPTKMERRVRIISYGKESSVSIGKNTSIRENTEIDSRGGKICVEGSVFINRNCIIASREFISIGSGTTIGPNTIIYDHDHDIVKRGSFVTNPIKIGKNVWIGSGVIILKGSIIGENSVIAAGCVITKNVEPNTICIQKREMKLYDKEQ